VVAQIKGRLIWPPQSPAPERFAKLLVGWLDPHGLWSAAPDAPARAEIRARSDELLRDIELGSRDASPCTAAQDIARITQRWVEELRASFERGIRGAPRLPARRAFSLVSESLFEDDPVKLPARRLAITLGGRATAFSAAFGEPVRDLVAVAAERFLPRLKTEEWQMAVLAAALRSYVPSVDAHGQWVPLEEEWSLYAGDSAIDVGPRLWRAMARTPVGVRVVEPGVDSLTAGDLVLAIGGIATAGLSVEQVEQLSRLEPVGAETARSVLVVDASSLEVKELLIDLSVHEPRDVDPPVLEAELVRYGSGDVMVVAIPEVSDRLGEQLAELVSQHQPSSLLGVLVDLRGNGGGSTDGAVGAIGVFLPGAPSVSLLMRGGSIEVQRAPAPPREGQWAGPVAVLVDGDTASAAEMIAGVIERYDRGPILGAHTFGKGCIQEYFDDRAGVGVLRLTTMVLALPDGSALQTVGLEPDIALPFSPSPEREKTLQAVPPAWRGPDIREPLGQSAPAWPPNQGHVGPCTEPWICQALRRLGTARGPVALARRQSPRR
jgi:carboxyl-terminal processing protease